MHFLFIFYISRYAKSYLFIVSWDTVICTFKFSKLFLIWRNDLSQLTAQSRSKQRQLSTRIPPRNWSGNDCCYPRVWWSLFMNETCCWSYHDACQRGSHREIDQVKIALLKYYDHYFRKMLVILWMIHNDAIQGAEGWEWASEGSDG